MSFLQQLVDVFFMIRWPWITGNPMCWGQKQGWLCASFVVLPIQSRLTSFRSRAYFGTISPPDVSPKDHRSFFRLAHNMFGEKPDKTEQKGLTSGAMVRKWNIMVYWCILMYSHPTIINPTSKNHPQASSIEIGGLVDGLRHGRYLHLAPGPMESCEGWVPNGWTITRCWIAIWLKYVEMAHIHETWDIFQRLVECWRYLNAKQLNCERNSVADPLYRNNKNRLHNHKILRLSEKCWDETINIREAEISLGVVKAAAK